ncbi:nuclear transport factor 2 family protein [Sphingobium sp.]|uniref:nuclear transport factor 2 family protein n=1 Tax=Sphingobium sp. TaxID=1912891 RepID=UPI003B3B1174
MTIEELLAREAVRDTIGRYVSATDRGRYGELADVFMPDGIIMFGDRVRYEGRDAIIAGMTEGAKKRGAFDSDAKFQRHLLGDPIIRVVDDSHARAVTYILVLSEDGVDASGVYIDHFEKSGARWLIASRYANMEWGRGDSRNARHFKPAPTPLDRFDLGFFNAAASVARDA